MVMDECHVCIAERWTFLHFEVISATSFAQRPQRASSAPAHTRDIHNRRSGDAESNPLLQRLSNSLFPHGQAVRKAGEQLESEYLGSRTMEHFCDTDLVNFEERPSSRNNTLNQLMGDDLVQQEPAAFPSQHYVGRKSKLGLSVDETSALLPPTAVTFQEQPATLVSPHCTGAISKRGLVLPAAVTLQEEPAALPSRHCASAKSKSNLIVDEIPVMVTPAAVTWRQQQVVPQQMIPAQSCSSEVNGLLTDWPEHITTLKIGNIPSRFTHDILILELDSLGMKDTYDFVYLPYARQCLRAAGYAFINYHSGTLARQAFELLDGHAYSGTQGTRFANACIADIQGFTENTKHRMKKEGKASKSRQRALKKLQEMAARPLD